jgi:hypothetical protein
MMMMVDTFGDARSHRTESLMLQGLGSPRLALGSASREEFR